MEQSKESPMVLRTVYLPQDLDDQLRGMAFNANKSKNDLIREFVRAGLKKSAAPSAAKAVAR